MKKEKKQNLIAFGIVILILVVALLCWYLMLHRRNGGTIAKIYQDNQLIRTIDLSEVVDSYEFTITNISGGSNRIKVEPGGISIVEASCPDHLCMQTGVIQSKAMPIICLPNHLVIQIEDEKENVLDVESY